MCAPEKCVRGDRGAERVVVVAWLWSHAANMSRKNQTECNVTEARLSLSTEVTLTYVIGRAGERVSIGQGRDGALSKETETDWLISEVYELRVSKRGSLAATRAGMRYPTVPDEH